MSKPKQEEEVVRPVVSGYVIRQMRQKVGRRGLPFVMGYEALFQTALDPSKISEFEDLKGRGDHLFTLQFFQYSARILSRSAKNELQAGRIREAVQGLESSWRLYSSRPTATQTLRAFGRAYFNALQTVLHTFGIYVKPLRSEFRAMPRLRKAKAEEAKLLKLKDTNPEAAQLIEDGKARARTIRRNIEAQIGRDGLEAKTIRLMGRPVQIGEDTVSGDKVVYNPDGTITPLEDWVAKEQQREAAIKRIQALGVRGKPKFSDLDKLSAQEIQDLRDNIPKRMQTVFAKEIEDLRRVPEDEIEALRDKIFDAAGGESNPDLFRERRRRGEIVRVKKTLDELIAGGFYDQTFVAITDDKQKSEPTTRTLSVAKDSQGKTFVIAGRYQGMYLDDLVNAAGRLIEGTSYAFDPTTRRRVAETRARGEVDTSLVPTRPEPFVSLTEDGKYMIRIPNTGNFTLYRNRVHSLITKSDTLDYVEGTAKTTYVFEDKDFELVQKGVGGFTMSSAATEKISAYFDRLDLQDKAYGDELSGYYSSEAIGGFQSHIKLRRTQQEALGWCEARGWSGLLSPDTGLGKTGVAIAAMQKMLNDEVTEGKKFLFVCPAKLVGNMRKEVLGFLDEKAAARLLGGVVGSDGSVRVASEDEDGEIRLPTLLDIISYEKFRTEFKKNPRMGNEYAAIFFDEVQKAKGVNQLSRAISGLNHPRKILLTASPMERDPEELFRLAALANNDPIYTNVRVEKVKGVEQIVGEMNPEFTDKMRKWKALYLKQVGGRIVGINDEVEEGFREWVKANLYFKDKMDAPEIELERPQYDNLAIAMDSKVEAEYKKVASAAAAEIEKMVAMYKDGEYDHGADWYENISRYRGFTGRLGKVFKKLRDLGDMPQDVIPGASNPKVDQAKELILERIKSGKKSILFTDNPSLASYTARELSLQFPMHYHAAGLSDKIQLYKAGEVVVTWGKEAYKPPVTPKNQSRAKWADADWAVFVLKYYINPKPDDANSEAYDVASLTLTSAYTKGQNLQQYTSVIHLDRDTWNSEEMKQRTARSWRAGQKETVDVITLDIAYQEPEDERERRDRTLDEIRKYVQDMEESLFNDIIKASQQASIGKSWREMEQWDASLLKVNRDMMEAAISPYANQIAEASGSALVARER